MDKDWRELLVVESPTRAALIKALLEENEIPVIILNQKDSSYLNFGSIKIHVLAKDVIRAKALIKEL